MVKFSARCPSFGVEKPVRGFFLKKVPMRFSAYLPFAFCLLTFSLKAQPPKINGIQHVALSVKDLTASAKFYHEILGFEPLDVPKALFGIRFWFTIAPGQELHLLNARMEMVTNNDRNASHFAVAIDSADDWELFFKKIGLKYHRQQRIDGNWQIYITDPDGYVIELNEPKK